MKRSIDILKPNWQVPFKPKMRQKKSAGPHQDSRGFQVFDKALVQCIKNRDSMQQDAVKMADQSSIQLAVCTYKTNILACLLTVFCIVS